jgi:hypothetical protein
MIFYSCSLYRSITRAFLILSFTISFAGFAQENKGGDQRHWFLSGTFHVSREVVRDDAYSKAPYVGWVPAATLAAHYQISRQLHFLSVIFGRGSLYHQSGGPQEMSLSQWGFSYDWMCRIKHYNERNRFHSMFGAGIHWSQLGREYNGYINSGRTEDRWGSLDLKAALDVRLDAQGKLDLLMDVGLGLLGFYKIGQKQPEANYDGGETINGRFVWMPGVDGFSGKANIRLQYKFGKVQRLQAGYNFQTDWYRRSPVWGFERQGVMLTYLCSL